MHVRAAGTADPMSHCKLLIGLLVLRRALASLMTSVSAVLTEHFCDLYKFTHSETIEYN